MTLWVIDVRDNIAEINMTLLSKSSGALDAQYQTALLNLVLPGAVEAVLYAYMVSKVGTHRFPNFILSEMSSDKYWGCRDHLACICLLVVRE